MVDELAIENHCEPWGEPLTDILDIFLEQMISDKFYCTNLGTVELTKNQIEQIDVNDLLSPTLDYKDYIQCLK